MPDETEPWINKVFFFKSKVILQNNRRVSLAWPLKVLSGFESLEDIEL